MLPAVTSKPYPPIPPEAWKGAQPCRVFLDELIATQEWVSLRVLNEPHPRVDPIHVVMFGGVKYIENGHHRVMRAALRRQRLTQALMVYR